MIPDLLLGFCDFLTKFGSSFLLFWFVFAFLKHGLIIANPIPFFCDFLTKNPIFFDFLVNRLFLC